MARLALVSRNPAMSMAIASTPHDVVEVRPYEFGSWLSDRNDADVDALVLDLGSASESIRVVGDMRAEHRWTPVLLVASAGADWDSDDVATLPGVDVLELPLSANRLQAAVEAVLRHANAPPAPVSVVTEASTALLDEVPEFESNPAPDFLGAPDSKHDGDTEAALLNSSPLASNHSPTGQDDPPPQERSLPDPAAAGDAEKAPAESEVNAADGPSAAPVELIPPVSHETPVLADEPRDSSTHVPATKARPRRRRDRTAAPPKETAPSPPELTATELNETAPRVVEPKRPTLPDPPPGGASGSVDAVAALLSAAQDLYTLAETSLVIVEDAVIKTRADAGALLVPDGSVWRVAAGVSLRPLEHRLQLTGDSWLVQNVAEAEKGILVEDSDVARQALRGAPLASRPHLIAAPVQGVHAIIVLARDGTEAFTDDSIASLAALSSESGPLLEQALKVRTLARDLARHIDLEQGLSR